MLKVSFLVEASTSSLSRLWSWFRSFCQRLALSGAWFSKALVTISGQFLHWSLLSSSLQILRGISILNHWQLTSKEHVGIIVFTGRSTKTYDDVYLVWGKLFLVLKTCCAKDETRASSSFAQDMWIEEYSPERTERRETFQPAPMCFPHQNL